MAFPILELPYELTRAIIQELDVPKDRPTLLALSLTCTILYTTAVELLYQHMAVNNITSQRLFTNILVRPPIITNINTTGTGPDTGTCHTQPLARTARTKVYHAFETPDFSFAAHNASTRASRRTAFFQMFTLLERSLPAAMPKLNNLKELSIVLDAWDTEYNRHKAELAPYLARWAYSQHKLFDLMSGPRCAFELESFACRNVREVQLEREHYALPKMLLRSQLGLRRLTFLNEVLPLFNQLSRPSRRWIEDDPESESDNGSGTNIKTKAKTKTKTASNLIFFRGRLKSMTTFLPLSEGRVEMLVWEIPLPIYTPPPFPMPEPRSEDASIESPFFDPIAWCMTNVRFLTIQRIDWGIPNLRKALVNLECLQLQSFSLTEDITYLKTLHLQILLVPNVAPGFLERAMPGMTIHRPPEQMYTVDKDILPHCPNIRYVGDCFSMTDDSSDNFYRIWDSRAGAGTGPETCYISKAALMCHHVFELLPRKYLS